MRRMAAPASGRLLRLVVGVALAFAADAGARTISITIGQKADLRDETLVVATTVGNTGDEAAKSVVVGVRFGDKQSRGKLHDELAPNGSFSEELSVPVGKLGEGRWPYQIAVDYADANQYPFQALLVYTFVVGNPPPAKVSVAKIGADPIADSGTLTVTVKNLAATERDVGWRIMAPEGLEATPATGTLHLGGWGESVASVTLINRTALAGSRYPVFAAIEYEDESVHQGVVSQGIVEIVAPRTFWERNQTLLIVGAGVLVALWLVLVLRRATGPAT